MIKRILTCLIISLSLWACNPTSPTGPSQGANPASTPSQSAESAPSFNLTAPDGGTVSFDPTVNPDEEVHLILFWSQKWDENTKILLERTSELHERYAPRGLVIIAVSYDEQPTELRKYLNENPLPFEVAVGSDATKESFGVESIPCGILVSKSGKIVDKWSGYYSTEELSGKISPHLPGRTGNS